MTQSPLPRWNSWDLDPEPNVSTQSDIQLAEELRRQLQQRLLTDADRKLEPRGE
jgi:hypothetical protein